MATLAEQLLEHGIRPRHYREGDQKLLCPRCSHTRKNRTDPCLSLLIDADGATWNCKNGCGFVGAVKEDRNAASRSSTARPRAALVKPKQSPGAPTPPNTAALTSAVAANPAP